MVLDRYKDDSSYWRYSAFENGNISKNIMDCEKTSLNSLDCYKDPPQSLPKDGFKVVCSKKIRIPPCSGGDPEEGTIYGLKK